MIVNINKEFAIRCQRKRISYNGFPEYPERFLRQKNPGFPPADYVKDM